MTQNKRIAYNTLATYGRSMFGVLCGIFSARWVLEALGEVDFGLYAVVGGMAIFIGFLNIQLAGAITRYYAYSIGQSKISGSKDLGLQECRAWFTTAVLIHTIVPVILVLIGWPLGRYAISHNWVNVPSERLYACLNVWSITCVSAFFGMVTVPFQAMYTAKQFIAELTIYSFLQTTTRTAFIYYMVSNPKDWLVDYAAAMGVLAVVPQLVICLRAYFVFPECRLVPVSFREFNRIKQVAGYALWTAFGGIGYVASHQCMGILVNNFFGAKTVSAFGVAQTISSEASSLTGALQGAFQPAIATSYGAGDIAGMKKMAFLVCKVGTILTLMFAIPMALEIDELLSLWLKHPPLSAAPMSLCMLAFIVIEKLSSGHLTAVNASGKIAKFQSVRGLLRTLVIPLAIVPAYLGWGSIAAVMALPISLVFVDVGDVLMARGRVGMSVRYWVKNIVFPIGVLTALVIVIGLIPQLLLSSSFYRIVITTMVSLAALLPGCWFIVLSNGERNRILQVLNTSFVTKRHGVHSRLAH